MADYQNYRAALEKRDYAAAEQAAERAWQGAEVAHASPDTIAKLAYNLVLLRVVPPDKRAAIAPARRALDLASAGAKGVDTDRLTLMLGEALLGEDYVAGRSMLSPALEKAGPALDDEAFHAAHALASAAAARADWAASARAWAAAEAHAAGEHGDLAMTRAEAAIGQGVAQLALQRDRLAEIQFYRAMEMLAPFAGERADGALTTAELRYIQAMAWAAATSARGQIPGKPKDRPKRPDPPGALPTCDSKVTISPMPKYPRKQLDDYGVGGAVVRLEVDASGVIVSHQVIASVPTNEFGRALEDPKIQWTREAKPNAAPCRTETKDDLVAVNFVIGF